MGFSFLDTYLLTYLSICLIARVQASQPCPNTTPAGWAHRESLTTTSDWHNTLCRVGAPAKGKSQLSTTPNPQVPSEWNTHRREQGESGCKVWLRDLSGGCGHGYLLSLPGRFQVQMQTPLENASSAKKKDWPPSLSSREKNQRMEFIKEQIQLNRLDPTSLTIITHPHQRPPCERT